MATDRYWSCDITRAQVSEIGDPGLNPVDFNSDSWPTKYHCRMVFRFLRVIP
jgi:hypothetical protein